MRFGNLLPGHEPERLMLLRPLLRVPKARLVATLEAAKIPYAEDPSNHDPRFARPRLRELMPLLAAEGLTAERLERLATRVRRAEMTLHEVLSAALLNLAPAPWPDQGPVVIDAGRFGQMPDEIGLRMLERIINHVGNEGPAELGKLEGLCGALVDAFGGGRFRRTLAGAVVTLHRDKITVERAPARKSPPNERATKRAMKKPALKRP